jgi:hypothetical protein
MRAVAGDLRLSFRVFAALAAVLFVTRYGTLASRMRTFLLLNLSHGLPFESGRYARQREYPHPPPPSKNNTRRTINTVVISHFSFIQCGAD